MSVFNSYQLCIAVAPKKSARKMLYTIVLAHVTGTRHRPRSASGIPPWFPPIVANLLAAPVGIPEASLSLAGTLSLGVAGEE